MVFIVDINYNKEKGDSMTREEIIKKLNYKGEYNDSVKKKLKKLLKQYHPDNNKKDKETILLLYEIKKELEEGTLEYISDTNITDDTENNKKISFFENILENLKKKRNEINNKINYLYKKFNKKIDEKNKKNEKLSEVEFKIENLKEEMDSLKRIDILDQLLITVIIVTLLCVLIFKLYFLILVIIFFIISEIYYIYSRYLDYNYKLDILKRLEKRKKKIDKECSSIEDNLSEMKKEEFNLKRERSKINNEIQYYSYEISKLKDITKSSNKSKGKSKEYVRK